MSYTALVFRRAELAARPSNRRHQRENALTTVSSVRFVPLCRASAVQVMPGFRLGSAKPSNNFPAQSGKPIPHAGEPARGHQLGFDDPEQSLHDEKTGGICDDKRRRTCDPMTLTRNGYRNQL